MHIIQVTTSHVSALATLICLLKQDTELPDRGVFFDLDAKSLPQAVYLMQRAEADEGFVLLAFHEERPVGLLLSALKLLNADEPSLELTIVVEKRARRQGVGTALMIAAERLAPEVGAAALTLRVVKDNTSAIRLYQNMGFDRSENDRNPDRDQDADRFFYMAKPVAAEL